MTIGIAGLGAMGIGIAQVFATAGKIVVATDHDAATRASAPARMAAALQARIDRGTLTADQKTAILARFQVRETLPEIAPADMVIEAVPERLDLKQAVFSVLEQYLAPDAVLATNTSSLSVGAIAGVLRHPRRMVGLHFFNPAPAMKLVELIAHAGTDAHALTTARTLTEAAGKTVITCPDRPGFIVNRCARPFYGEALALLEEGRRPGDIDAAMLAAGYRIGPFALIDLIGADINLAATESLSAAMGGHPRYHVFNALKAQVASGEIGRKSLKGFIFPEEPPPPPGDAAAIALRIEATLVNEAAWLLSEGGSTADGIDTALRLGLNFPRGPFQLLAHHGPATILQTLAKLAENAPPQMRSRYTPAPGLAP